LAEHRFGADYATSGRDFPIWQRSATKGAVLCGATMVDRQELVGLGDVRQSQ
jgi:hypothetical protein